MQNSGLKHQTHTYAKQTNNNQKTPTPIKTKLTKQTGPYKTCSSWKRLVCLCITICFLALLLCVNFNVIWIISHRVDEVSSLFSVFFFLWKYWYCNTFIKGGHSKLLVFCLCNSDRYPFLWNKFPNSKFKVTVGSLTHIHLLIKTAK